MNFRLGLPRGFVVSPDGQRVVFLRVAERHVARARAVGVRRRRAAPSGLVADPARLLGDGDEYADPGGARAPRAAAGRRRRASSPTAPTTRSRWPRSLCRRGCSSATSPVAARRASSPRRRRWSIRSSTRPGAGWPTPATARCAGHARLRGGRGAGRRRTRTIRTRLSGVSRSSSPARSSTGAVGSGGHRTASPCSSSATTSRRCGLAHQRPGVPRTRTGAGAVSAGRHRQRRRLAGPRPADRWPRRRRLAFGRRADGHGPGVPRAGRVARGHARS